jgi:hypothetical protein
MSTAEIADNKWEVQASKPPVATMGGFMQLVMISGFAGLFGYLTVMSIIGAVSPKADQNHIEKGFGQGGAAAK